MSKQYFQQGDVLLFKVEDTKELASKRESKVVKYTRTSILQHGEATGHAHRISSPGFQLFENNWNPDDKYLMLKKQGTLTHEEHKPIVLPRGLYRVQIVREYDHFQKIARKVRD